MPQRDTVTIPRRTLVAGLVWGLAAPARAAAPSDGKLRFVVSRNGAKVGEHEMVFTQAGPLLTVVTDVDMVIRVGPVPVFRYSHRAREQWRNGGFLDLATSTASNGKRETVAARRGATGLSIDTAAGPVSAPPKASPLTHWNTAAFGGPMFNPQTGKVLKVSATRANGRPLPYGSATGTCWAIRGEAEIDDWYDGDGVWTALSGRLPDRSIMEYRRA